MASSKFKILLINYFLYLRMARKCFNSIQVEMPTGNKFPFTGGSFIILILLLYSWVTFKINKKQCLTPNLKFIISVTLPFCSSLGSSWPTILICETFVTAVLPRTRALTFCPRICNCLLRKLRKKWLKWGCHGYRKPWDRKPFYLCFRSTVGKEISMICF